MDAHPPNPSVACRTTHGGKPNELTFATPLKKNPPSPSAVEDQAPRAPSPNIILRCQNDFLSSHKSAWDSPSDGEGDEADKPRVPDVRRDDLASRRAPRGPVAFNVHQFVPRPACSSKDRERWEGIRLASQRSLQEKESRSAPVCVCVCLRLSSFLLKRPAKNSPFFLWLRHVLWRARPLLDKTLQSRCSAIGQRGGGR